MRGNRDSKTHNKRMPSLPAQKTDPSWRTNSTRSRREHRPMRHRLLQ